jgi:hypothetical protein
MQALADAGAPFEAILIAVKAVEEVQAEVAARDAEAAERRARDAERKRLERASKDSPRTQRGRVQEPSPNEYNLTPTAKPECSDEHSAPSDFADEVVEVWNREIVGTPLPVARKLTPERRKHLNARVKVHGKEAVPVAIRAMCQSDFHSGKSGKWTHGNLGWLLKNDENFTKMLERKAADQPCASGKQWTAEEQRAHLAKLERFGLGEGQPPPPAANREPTSFGKPIGHLLPRAGTA